MIEKMLMKKLKKAVSKILKTKDIPLELINNDTITIEELSRIDSKSSIGDYTYIGKNCNITKTTIGRFCSIANNVSIGQGEHDLRRISTSSLFYANPYEELTQKDCIIGNDVWIGSDSVILRGVTLGDGSVIGANSVVTKDIPPFAVAVGSPAKVIKYRHEEAKRVQIIESKWWKKDLEGAKKAIMELEK